MGLHSRLTLPDGKKIPDPSQKLIHFSVQIYVIENRNKRDWNNNVKHYW